jgi:predicted extracellular nuclease
LPFLLVGNDVRVNAANKLALWLNQLSTCSAIGIIGDLNSYAFENPIKTLEAAGYINLEGTNTYSYVFDGNMGTLDYALANSFLNQRVTTANVWHVNADEADALDYNLDFGRSAAIFDGSVPYRYSDHDPLLFGVNLQCNQTRAPSNAPTSVPTELPITNPTGTPTTSPTQSPMSVATLTPTIIPTIAVTQVPTSFPSQDLIISEYIEGTSNNKALEFCNPSSVAVNLATENYVVQIYNNNNTTPTNTIALVGTVPSGESFVLSHSSAVSAIISVANQTSGSVSYNGDDVVVLRKGGANGSVVDSIGRIGNQPNVLFDITLRKKSCDLRDTVTSDAFDRTILYDSFPVDTFTNLRTCPLSCSLLTSVPTPVPISQPTNAPSVLLPPNITSVPTVSSTLAPTTSQTAVPTVAPTDEIVSHLVVLCQVLSE